MRGFFSVDSKFYTLCSRIVDLAILSVLSLAGSVLVISIVPAIAALNYSVKLCVIDERGRSYREYIRFYKEHFLQGLKYGAVIMSLSAALVFLVFTLVTSVQNSSAISNAAVFAGIAAFMLLIILGSFVLWLCILFPSARLSSALLPKLTLVAAIKQLPLSFLMIIMLAAGILLTVVSPPLILILPALLSLLCVTLTEPALQRLYPDYSYYNLQEKQP